MSPASAAALEPEHPGEHAPHALIVDDEATNRLILRGLLSRLGYRITECVNGADAVAVSSETRFDIVFMDVMMPVMDGVAATRIMKSREQQRFVPIIFLTALSDESTVARCLDAGGDDILAKPYSVAVLRAKVSALQRIQALQDRVTSMHAQQVRDEQIAEKLFSRVVGAGNFSHPSICAELRPAARFSGDVFLVARAPSGEIYVLLGDFTGHGLAAAIGALPVSEAFRAMTAKGFAPEQILRSINRKLNTLFPTGMFMAAHFIAIDPSLKYLRVANCGMPDLLVFGPDPAQAVTNIVAHSLALGITQDMFLRDGPRTLPIEPGSRVLLASDGLFEAVAPDGTAFGTERVLNAMRGVPHGAVHGLPAVLDELERFCGAAPQADDITAIEILCDASLMDSGAAESGNAANIADLARDGWQVHLTLHGSQLAVIDPVPMIMNQLQELAGVEAQQSALFTVLTELFVNALDHGVLKLDSGLKTGSNGFEAYMNERARRLAELDDGWVSIAVSAPPGDHKGAIEITISDSGGGFDVAAYHLACEHAASTNTPLPFGRGLSLVRALCAGMEHDASGAQVKVDYPWR
ncbi:MAG: SpoIIE family protein phosphatase [Proteobacteria bacterium]|jgi:CheY-like chemotaxis protein|nr:SpoIIE family protein phosphatase [Pseudomonadota bacterium]